MIETLFGFLLNLLQTLIGTLLGKRKPRLKTNAITVGFGGGQPREGRPHIRITNRYGKTLYDLKLTISIRNRNRKRGQFWKKRWIVYVGDGEKEWEYIGAGSILEYPVDLDKLDNFIQNQGLGTTWETKEPVPRLINLLQPSPVQLFFEISFLAEPGIGDRVSGFYLFQFKCQFPQTLIGDYLHLCYPSHLTQLDRFP